MKLYEYQAKALFERYGIPTVRGEAVSSPQEASGIARRLGGRVVVKAQVLVGGRGKAGGVKIAGSPEEAETHAAKILGMEIKGITVGKVLVAEAVRAEREFYLALTVDRTAKKVVLIASAEGGVDIEELAKTSPEKIRIHAIHPIAGVDEEKAQEFLNSVFSDSSGLDIPPGNSLADRTLPLVRSLYALLTEQDCSLVEINPLALLEGGRLAALDAKVVADDSGLFKHPELSALRNPEEYGADEIEAKRHGLSFVGMDGSIGCMVNGAGLAMATMDLIKLFGADPANFLDVGGSSNPEKVVAAFGIITRNPKVKAILVNIFGGITRCDDVARGFVQAKRGSEIKIPIVIRLIGTNEKEGAEILRREGIPVHQDLITAVKKAVALAGG
jgi:succinyl-CoA synthetase beta subunit